MARAEIRPRGQRLYLETGVHPRIRQLPISTRRIPARTRPIRISTCSGGEIRRRLAFTTRRASRIVRAISNLHASRFEIELSTTKSHSAGIAFREVFVRFPRVEVRLFECDFESPRVEGAFCGLNSRISTCGVPEKCAFLQEFRGRSCQSGSRCGFGRLHAAASSGTLLAMLLATRADRSEA